MSYRHLVLMSITFLWGVLVLADQRLDQMVHIKGQAVSADEVLQQLIKQTGLKISTDAKDQAKLRKNYDHKTSAKKVLNAFVEYHREYNQLNLKIVNRGHGQIQIIPVIQKETLVKKEKKKEKKIILEDGVKEEPNRKGVIVGLVLPANKNSLEERRKKLVATRVEAEKKEEAQDLRVEKKEFVEQKPIDINRKRDLDSISKKQKIEVLDLVGIHESRTIPKMTKKEEKEEKPKKVNTTQSEPEKVKRPNLIVEFVKDDKKVLSQTGVPLDLDFLDEDQSELKKEDKKSLEERVTEVPPSKTSLDELLFTDMFSAEFSGAQSGFFFPQALPSKILKKEQQFVAASLSAQEADVNGLPSTIELIESTSYHAKVLYKRGLMDNIEGLIEIKGGLQDGDLRLAGVANRDLNAAIGDTVLGFNGLLVEDKEKQYRIISGLRLKLPTGSTKNFMSSEDFDAGLYVAGYQSVGKFTPFVQLGYTAYGDHSSFQAIKTQAATNAMLGSSYKISPSYNLHGMVVYSQSPFDKTGRPDFYEDDIVQFHFGLVTETKIDALGVNLHLGTTDSSTDVGVQFSWSKFFE